jgi:hypothetical protein
MPTVSEFFGISISLYYNDHEPPHFHATYAEHEASLELQGLTVLRGRLPTRALAFVREWALAHQTELLANWRRARDGLPLEPIAPLDQEG